ncbi:MAG: YfiR family protein [Alphaproteobacteria bacterium]|nr:YfiR family protein [Alphaproteobacteria bacterium]
MLGDTPYKLITKKGKLAQLRFIVPILILYSALTSNALATKEYNKEFKEYEIMAVFVYNLIEFTEWPDKTASTPTRICIYGQDPIGELLSSFSKNRKFKFPILVVEQVPDSELKKCHILYVSPAAKDYESSLLTLTKNLPILTVSNNKGFAKRGGTIGFTWNGDSIALEANYTSIKKAGLTVDSELLDMAHIYK